MSDGKSPEELLKRLRRLKENQACPNCGTVAPHGLGFGNICVKFKTFVCDLCKTSHQAISHRVKSVTMSTWTVEEVMELSMQRLGGNEVARHVWLSKAPSYGGKYPGGVRPKAGDRIENFKNFVVDCYEHGMFKSTTPFTGSAGDDEDAPPHDTSSSSSSSSPQTRATKTRPQREAPAPAPAASAVVVDLLDSGPAVCFSAPAPSSSRAGDDFFGFAASAGAWPSSAPPSFAPTPTSTSARPDLGSVFGSETVFASASASDNRMSSATAAPSWSNDPFAVPNATTPVAVAAAPQRQEFAGDPFGLGLLAPQRSQSAPQLAPNPAATAAPAMLSMSMAATSATSSSSISTMGQPPLGAMAAMTAMRPSPMGMMQPPMGMMQPQMGMMQPPMGMMQPPMGMMQPQMGMMQPPMGMMQPQMGMMQPPMGMMQPQMGMMQPQMGMMQPQMGMMQPQMGMMQQQQQQYMGMGAMGMGSAGSNNAMAIAAMPTMVNSGFSLAPAPGFGQPASQQQQQQQQKVADSFDFVSAHMKR